MLEPGVIAIVAVLGLLAIWVIFYFVPVGLWFTALISGAHISLLQMVLMRWRKIPVSTIVSSMIEGTKAGLKLNPNSLEAHYLAGGNVEKVVHALVSASKANIELSFQMATAIDLAGRDVFELGGLEADGDDFAGEVAVFDDVTDAVVIIGDDVKTFDDVLQGVLDSKAEHDANDTDAGEH